LRINFLAQTIAALRGLVGRLLHARKFLLLPKSTVNTVGKVAAVHAKYWVLGSLPSAYLAAVIPVSLGGREARLVESILPFLPRAEPVLFIPDEVMSSARNKKLLVWHA
jgi:hypothetical protein